MAGTVRLSSPIVVDKADQRPPAARLASVSGLRLGFVDNSKVNADSFIDRVAEDLTRTYGADVACRIRKFAPKDPLGATDLARLADCDAVIQCFGDCGTSTSVSVADAVALEKQGVPTVTVFSTAFSQAAQFQALGNGLAGLPMVEIPHPMHSAGRAAVLQRAEEAVERIVLALTDPAYTRSEGAIQDEDLTLVDTNLDDQEIFFARGWTDGLPIVPPTLEKVEAMLAAGGRDQKEVVGAIPPRMRPATVEKIAVNAVMAGCRPDYFRVVLAAVEAMIDEDAKLYGVQTATNMSAPLVVLNGPVIERINANSGRDLLGAGNRANLTIGRAVRLVCRNIGGELPNKTDMATHGQPGKLSFCFAEAEHESPWTPWHVDLGLAPTDSAVTVLAGASSPHNIFTYGCENGEQILDHFVGAVTALGNNNIIFPTGPLFIVSPEHAGVLARDGFGKAEIRQFVFEKARIPMERFGERSRIGLRHRRSNWFETVGDPDHIGVADRPEDIHIVVAGGPGIHSLFVPTSFSVRPVVRQISGA